MRVEKAYKTLTHTYRGMYSGCRVMDSGIGLANFCLNDEGKKLVGSLLPSPV